jgi:hypothetical protein
VEERGADVSDAALEPLFFAVPGRDVRPRPCRRAAMGRVVEVILTLHASTECRGSDSAGRYNPVTLTA